MAMPFWAVICMDGHMTSLRRRITPDIVHTQRWLDMTPLMIASQYGQSKAVALLLQVGADVNAQNSNGHLAMHYARDCATVQLLLRAGAPIDGPAGFSRTVASPLSFALYNDRTDAARAMIDFGARLDRSNGPIPKWVAAFVAAREWCRYAALLLLGVRKLRRSTVLGDNNRDVIKMIAYAVWQTRMDHR